MKLYKKSNRWIFQIGKNKTHGPKLKPVLSFAFGTLLSDLIKSLKKLYSREALLGYAIALIDASIILTW